MPRLRSGYDVLGDPKPEQLAEGGYATAQTERSSSIIVNCKAEGEILTNVEPKPNPRHPKRTTSALYRISIRMTKARQTISWILMGTGVFSLWLGATLLETKLVFVALFLLVAGTVAHPREI